MEFNADPYQLYKEHNIMKKIVLLSLLALFSFSINAQDTPKDSAITNNSFVVTKFHDNWSLKFGVNASSYFGQNDNKLDFGKRIAPGFTVAAGKWITPWIGVQLGLDGMQLKGATPRANGPYVQNADMLANGFYKQKWFSFMPHADLMVNIANLFFKYKENRIYSPIITGGAGFIADSKGSNYSQAVQFAFVNKFRVSEAWDINLDLKGAWVGNDFDSEGGTRGDGLFSIGVSATYRFKTRKFTPYQPKYIKDTKAADEWKARYDAANNKANRLQSENTDLKEALKNAKSQTTPVKEIVKEPVKPQLIIYYTADSYSIKGKDMILLRALAKEMKKNTDSKYEVCGYADNKTGTPEYNSALREKRADAVINTLISLGVDKDQLIKKTSDQPLNQFDAYALDRAVTITKI